jgi:hypothetical protein
VSRKIGGGSALWKATVSQKGPRNQRPPRAVRPKVRGGTAAKSALRRPAFLAKAVRTLREDAQAHCRLSKWIRQLENAKTASGFPRMLVLRAFPGEREPDGAAATPLRTSANSTARSVRLEV